MSFNMSSSSNQINNNQQPTPACGPSSAIFPKIVQPLAPGSPPGTKPRQENTIPLVFQKEKQFICVRFSDCDTYQFDYVLTTSSL